ncbi:hypothetical protein ACFQHN_11830 [Natrialbaceae archaeon GCM10025896]
MFAKTRIRIGNLFPSTILCNGTSSVDGLAEGVGFGGAGGAESLSASVRDRVGGGRPRGYTGGGFESVSPAARIGDTARDRSTRTRKPERYRTD